MLTRAFLPILLGVAVLGFQIRLPKGTGSLEPTSDYEVANKRYVDNIGNPLTARVEYLESELSNTTQKLNTLANYLCGTIEANPHSSCGDVEDCFASISGNKATEGYYWIQTDLMATPVQAYCALLNSHLWMLIGNYQHLANADNVESIRSSPPKFVERALGEGNSEITEEWGHMGSAVADYQPSEFRFYCKDSAGTVVDVSTSVPECVTYFTTGSGFCGNRLFPSALTTEYPRATYNFSTAALSGWSDEGDSAITQFPFYVTSGTGEPRPHFSSHQGNFMCATDYDTAVERNNKDTIHLYYIR